MLNYIQISKQNLIHNITQFRKIIPKESKIAAVIKANAYGHGQNIVAKVLDKYVDYFQIDDFLELKSFTFKPTKPILILGHLMKSELEEVLVGNRHACSLQNVILTIYDIEQVKLIDKISAELNKKSKVHICIDACLGRDGILLRDLEEFICNLKDYQNIIIDGVYSHFANIEDTTDSSHANKQLEIYEKALKIFEKNGFKNIKRHICATSGVLVGNRHACSLQDIVRIGTGLYGMWPSEDLKKENSKLEIDKQLNLKPALNWISHIAQIKTLPANYTVGYGLTYTTEKETKVAIIPQGYSDGYDRKLSNCGEVLIGGKRCRVLGRISMNMMTVDISELNNVEVEDEVVLLGNQLNEKITAEELAEKTGTINYEIPTRITSLLPRTYNT